MPAEPAANFSNNPRHTIKFRHPGYSDACELNVFLTLKAFDRAQGGALHYGTAHVACAIVAGNAWDGYFALKRGGAKLNLSNDSLLTERSYYFHVPPSPSWQAQPTASDSQAVRDLLPFRYPLYGSFREWRFPHDDIPPAWSDIPQGHTTAASGYEYTFSDSTSVSSVAGAVINRDRGCVVTGYGDGLESAHLCPKSETKWFSDNGMINYNRRGNMSGDIVVDDVANQICLRSDVHTVFDSGAWVIVPKEGGWVIHFCNFTNTLGFLYHNTPLKLSNMQPEFLLARFAWTIFPLIKQFITSGGDRYLRVRVEDNCGPLGENFAVVSASKLKERSLSPKKRKVNPSDNPPDLSARQQSGKTSKRQRRSSSSTSSASSTYRPSSRPRGRSLTRYQCGSKPIPNLAFISPQSKGQALSPIALSPLHMDLEPCQFDQASEHPFVRKITPTDPFISMQKEWVRNQRPSDPTLYCCDYRAAEAAYAAGIEGPRKFGGAHLCLECQGMTYMEDINELEPVSDEEEKVYVRDGGAGDVHIRDEEEKIFCTRDDNKMNIDTEDRKERCMYTDDEQEKKEGVLLVNVEDGLAVGLKGECTGGGHERDVCIGDGEGKSGKMLPMNVEEGLTMSEESECTMVEEEGDACIRDGEGKKCGGLLMNMRDRLAVSAEKDVAVCKEGSY